MMVKAMKMAILNLGNGQNGTGIGIGKKTQMSPVRKSLPADT